MSDVVSTDTPTARRTVIVMVLLAVAFHLVLACTAIALQIEGTSEWADQQDYHLPAIQVFAEQLPTPSLSDYKSATTPGYHLVMAMLLRAGASDSALHLLNALFGGACVAMFTLLIARRTSGAVALAAGCVLGASPYVLSSSVWLTTDNLAMIPLLAGLAAALTIADGSTRSLSRSVLVSALWACAAAAIRQILVYTAAFAAAAVVARACATRSRPKVSDLALAALALLPACILVGIFVVLWGGLVPPSFRAYHGTGANPVTPIYVLALVGIWGMASFLAMPGFLRELCSRRIALLAALACAIAVTVESSYIVHVRFGGIVWTAASKFPAPFGRSIVIVPLAAIGAAALGAYLRLWSRSSDSAGRGVGACALFVLVGMTLAQTANQQCFERYLQPMVFMLCALASVAIAGRSMRTWPLWSAAVVSVGLSAWNVFRIGN